MKLRSGGRSRGERSARGAFSKSSTRWRIEMAMTGGDVLVETLIDWGVDTIFGIPGDGINGVFEALRQREDKIRFVQVRHEEAAAFAACAYAKFTGRLGVCLATSGRSEERRVGKECATRRPS